MLMAREEAETVSKGWCFKERHHVHPLMAREEAETVSKRWCFKAERHHVQVLMARGKGRYHEQAVVLQRTTPRTS